jgi:hypothetical protein
MTDFSMRNEPLYGTSSIIGITDIINEKTVNTGVTVEDVLLKDNTVTVNNIILGDGIDNGTMINIDADAAQLSTDTNNSDVTKWFKVYDEASASNMYVPMFSSPNVTFQAGGYIPCSSWCTASITTGNDQDSIIIWETLFDNSADGETAIISGANQYFSLDNAGVYIFTISISCDAASSLEDKFVSIVLKNNTTELSRINQSLASTGTGFDYSNNCICIVVDLTATELIHVLIEMGDNNAYTTTGHISIVRIS